MLGAMTTTEMTLAVTLKGDPTQGNRASLFPDHH